VGAGGDHVVPAVVLKDSGRFAAGLAHDAAGPGDALPVAVLGGSVGVVLIQQRDIQAGVHLAGIDHIGVVRAVAVAVHALVHKDGHVAGFAQAVGVVGGVVVHAGHVDQLEGAERAVALGKAHHRAAVAAGAHVAFSRR